MNLRQHKRRAAAGLTRRGVSTEGRRLYPHVQFFVGWVRCTGFSGIAKWFHQYTGIAR